MYIIERLRTGNSEKSEAEYMQLTVQLDKSRCSSKLAKTESHIELRMCHSLQHMVI